jgi:hypothetical protein
MSSVLKKRRKKMRKHKYKKLRRRQKLGSPEQGKEESVPEGKKVRIRVRTATYVYVGDFLIPPMRNRVSDAINEEQRLFISLTDVLINEKERSDFVAINKNLIESIAQL